MATAKGAALRATLAYIESTAGPQVRQRVLDSLLPDLRARVDTVTATDEIPFGLLVALWHAADAVMRPIDAEWMEKAGSYSIESSGSQSYAGII